jgi:hypothetical protein
MTDHPHQLYAVDFTEADQARLGGFSCGDEPWSKHVTEWILGSDVLDSMKRGTRVWLFETAQGEVVGFGSVGTSEWRWPPPKGSKTTECVFCPPSAEYCKPDPFCKNQQVAPTGFSKLNHPRAPTGFLQIEALQKCMTLAQTSPS